MKHALTIFRKEQKLSQAAVARLARTSRQTIHRIERGEQTPSLDLVRRLIDASQRRLRADDFLPTSQIGTHGSSRA